MLSQIANNDLSVSYWQQSFNHHLAHVSQIASNDVSVSYGGKEALTGVSTHSLFNGTKTELLAPEPFNTIEEAYRFYHEPGAV